jgi:hypothetical protein
MDDETLRDRLQLIDDRQDHETTERDALEARVLALESDKEVKKAHTLEYIVIFIITVETIFSAIMCFHHG